jgi:tetratricopeptide (TPR) repeat protein
MGYCHIDAKQFASAFSKFRAALAVSSRYEPALRGVAEAYQQQGRKEQAIEAYKAYLDVYPDSSAAKKQLERLGGDTASPPPAGSGAAAPAPTPVAPTPVAPPPTAPEPPAQGSGSG